VRRLTAPQAQSSIQANATPTSTPGEDAKGNPLGRFANTTMSAVVAGRDYHYIVTADKSSMTLDPRAVRFQATASCNGNG
jgi:hypothetical protein